MSAEPSKGTTWPDVSEHNGRPVDDTMPYPVLAYRVNDGTYLDQEFKVNDTWARRQSKLRARIAYVVWPRSLGWSTWQSTWAVTTGALGTGHQPRLVVMTDVEAWNRPDLAKDHSADLEALRQAQVAWLNGLRPSWQRRWPWRALYRSADERRVIGYGNHGDLATMAPHVRWRYVVLADYSSAPTSRDVQGRRVIARQFTDAGICRPWGRPVDLNRSTLGPRRLARALGLGRWRWTP